MFYLLGFSVLLLSAGGLVGLLGNEARAFLDLPSLLLVLLPSLFVLAATRSFAVFGSGLRALILPKEPLREAVRIQAASLFRLLSKVTALAVGAVLLLGLANLLLHIDLGDARLQTYIGWNIAAAMTAPIYALLLIAGLFEPAVFLLKKRRETAPHA